MLSQTVSVLVPARNEAENIPLLLAKVAKAFSALGLDGRAELVLIDDGSTDGTGDVAASQIICLLYTSPSPRDRTRSRMPSSA